MTPFFSMTRRIFTKIFDSKNNDPFFGNIDPKKLIIVNKNMTLRIELLKVWLKALNPLFQYESTNRTHFSNMSQRIEPFLKIWLEELNFFFEYWLKELNFFEFDAKNWWSFSLKFWQQRIELSFQKWLNELNMTQRIEPFFSMWLKELNFLFVSKCDSKNWTFELFYKYGLLWEFNPFEPFHMTKRIGPILHDSKNWTLLNYHSKNWIFFFMTQRIEPFFEETQWIEYFLWSKELYFLCWMWSKELNLFLLNVTQRIESLLKNMKNWSFLQIWLRIEPFLNLSYDSKKWTFFDMTQRIKPFACDSKNWNFSTKSESKNGFFRMWLKELKFFNMTQRIEYDAQNWTSLFSNMTLRIEHLFSRIWRTELNISFLEYDAQNWTSFLEYDAQNWTSHLFSNMTHRIFLIWLTDFCLIWLIELNIFFSKWLIELNIFFSKWLKGLIFSKVTQRIELIFWKNNPQDWTFSLIWSKERIEILWYDSKDWIFLIWLTEPNTFFNITQRIELFSPIDSKKWTFFSNWLKEVNFYLTKYDPKVWFFLIWLKEPNTFLNTTQRIAHFFNMTQRIELFSSSDSKKWTFFWQNMTQRFDFFWYDSKNRKLFWMWLKELNFFF